MGSFALLAAPFSVWAHQAGKVRRIGYLSGTSMPRPGASPAWEAFLLRLRELGYVEGQNLQIEWRFSDGNVQRLPGLAAELVGLNPDVIVVLGTPATQAVRRETATIPIVMVGGVDPVEAGLVASLARPGGNVTGTLQDVGQDALVKTLGLLEEMVPRSSRVPALVGPHRVNVDAFELLKRAATTLGLTLHAVNIAGPSDIEQAFAAMARDRPDALMVLPSHPVIVHRQLVVDLALRHRIPAAYWFREMVNIGGLMSYGVDWTEVYRRAADYVGRILGGAKPADLPVEQPAKFELVINLKTAKALGLMIPPSMLLRANHVID